ncbi:MAG: M56 family metallopeptidase [Clostridia bacterium]|nr:M56 family metallopeptidase [Clostridia bacterium]
MVVIFNTILQMSINASIIILAVILARTFLYKAPKRFSYLLWSVVGFRLCCPISFNAFFSIFELFEPNAPRLPDANGDIIINSGQPNSTTAPLDEILHSDGTVINAEFADRLNRIEVFNTVVMVVWFTGMFAVLLYAVVSYFKVKHQMANAVKLKQNVFMSDKICSPFTLGFVFPKIYIPFGLDETTLEQILSHERCHIKRCDHIIKPLAFIILAIHWFNPFCWIAFKLMSLDMEMSCDEKVLRLQGDTVMKKNYTRALLSFATNNRFPVPSPIAFSESNGNAKKRIKHALNWKKPKIFVNITALVLCLLFLVACGADAESAKWKKVKTETFGDVPYNIVYISNGDGTCSVKEVRVDKDFKGDVRLVIPEKAPNGDTVTRFNTGWDNDTTTLNLPAYMTYDDMQKVCINITETEEFKYNGKFGDVGVDPERDAKIFNAFYAERTSENNKYYVLEPNIAREECERLSEILNAYGYDADNCYDFIMNFLDIIPKSEDEKNEFARDAFKRIYLNGNQIAEITLPETVKFIDYGAFWGCESLAKINGLSDDCQIQVYSTKMIEEGGNTIESSELIYVAIKDIEKYSDDSLTYFIKAIKG